MTFPVSTMTKTVSTQMKDKKGRVFERRGFDVRNSVLLTMMVGTRLRNALSTSQDNDQDTYEVTPVSTIFWATTLKP